MMRLKDMCYEHIKGAMAAVKKYCPQVLQRDECWKDTLSSELIFKKCTKADGEFNPIQFLSSVCDYDGNLLSDPVTNITCNVTEDTIIRKVANGVYLSGYAVSTFIMIMALLTFWACREVKCTRIRIHVNLFVAVILANIFWSLWYENVLRDFFVELLNPTWCQRLHVLTYYLLMTSVFWILCEGLDLFLAVDVFYRRGTILRFICIGWILPALIMAAYSVARVFYYKDTEMCWTEGSHAFNIISGIMLGSLFISLLLLLSVVYNLYVKVVNVARNPRQMIAIVKAAKTALILIPLFGLNFWLIPMYPTRENSINPMYLMISAGVATLQGLCSAMIFCFTNRDVINYLRQLFNCCQPEPDFDISLRDMSGHARPTTRF